MKTKGVSLTPEILMSGFERARDSFGSPSQFIVNPNIDFSELNKPLPKKTPEEIERERIKEALETLDLIRELNYSFDSYIIEHSDYGYFITATKHKGDTIKNTCYYDHYFLSLNDAIKDILEKIK